MAPLLCRTSENAPSRCAAADPVARAGARCGVLLIGHGTRNDAGAAEFDLLTQRLRQQVGDRPVEGCFLELRPPTIGDAWGRLHEAGVRHVHVAPLLLFSAGHAKQDIPEAIERQAAETPAVTYDFARPLSRHPLLIELAVERARQAWQQLAASGDRVTAGRVALVMVGRGSHDPCAQADMRLLTELVGWRFGVAGVETAFYAMARPTLPEVLDRLAGSQDVDAIIVQPHLLFQGAIRDAVGRLVDEASERHRQVRFLVSPHMGPDRRVAAAIAARIEALSPSRM